MKIIQTRDERRETETRSAHVNCEKGADPGGTVWSFENRAHYAYSLLLGIKGDDGHRYWFSLAQLEIRAGRCGFYAINYSSLLKLR